jgi:predicted RNase H-like HicB family nuclease
MGNRLGIESRFGDNRLMKLTAILIPEPEGGYTASNPETGTTPQGETIDEALANLQEATELFLEEFPTDGRRTLTSS